MLKKFNVTLAFTISGFTLLLQKSLMSRKLSTTINQANQN